MKTNNSNVLEGRITLVMRHIKGSDGKAGNVERYVVDGEKVVYMDVLTNRMFCYRLEHPDLLTALQRFCAGDGGLYIGGHVASRCKKRNDLVELFQFIRFHLQTQKLNFRIKLFKLCRKYEFLRFKGAP